MHRTLLVLVLAACAKAPAISTPEMSMPAPVGDDLVTAMHKNFEGVHVIHEAVIRGDLEGAKVAAAALAAKPRIENLPEPWLDPQVDARVAAMTFSEATDLQSAAEHTAALAGTCANCHRTTVTGPGFYAVQEPDEAASPSDHMQHHAWGLDLMWKGLIAPDDTLYSRGASALAAADLAPVEGASDAFTALEERVHANALAGAEADDAAQRQKAYADVIVACGSCHAQLGLKPDLPWSPTLLAPQDR